MTTLISLIDSIVILNGHLVEGWANDANALMFDPSIEAVVYEYGPDGTMIASRTGIKGTPLTIKLQANSPSGKFFWQQSEIVREGRAIEWHGSVAQPHGLFHSLSKGVMTHYPGGQSLGSGIAPMIEFAFAFQECKRNPDAIRS